MPRPITDLIGAELFQLRRRRSTWVLLVLWLVIVLFFNYVTVLLSAGGQRSGELAAALMENLVPTITSGFPFYGGAIALMLGVLAIGSEYGQGTLKTIFTQGPGRRSVLGAKLAALMIVLVPFVLAGYLAGAAGSLVVAAVEGQPVAAPPLVDLLAGIAAGWLILAVWVAIGAALATLTRGTSLAIGIGVLWALALEGILSATVSSVSWLDWVSDVLLRANAYSLVEPLTGTTEAMQDGPGYFAGPFVGTGQSLLMLAATLLLALGISHRAIRRRDVV